MTYRQHIDLCFSDAVAGGVDRAVFARGLDALAPALADLARRRADGSLPLLALPGRSDDLADLEALAADWRRRFRRVVLLGTGGSSLGARALVALAEAGGGPELVVPDNLDADGSDVIVAGGADPETAFLIVSKSGGTAETMAQALIAVRAIADAAGDGAVAGRTLAIVEPGASALARLAERFGMPTRPHDPNVGGRYSVLSLVGLLPALLAGVDARAVRRGAAHVLDRALAGGAPAGIAPAAGAALAAAAAGGGLPQSVLLCYAERLRPFALWYRQLWAESLGKGGKGTTPIDALGPVDQHSQLQLYLDGPNDKLFTVVDVSAAGRGPAIDAGLAGDLGLGYLAGRRVGDLVDAMARATQETLAANGRPLRRMVLPRLDAEGLGALLMHFMLETVLTAHLLGVDPFDQPAVEQGKVLARRYLDERAPGGGPAAP